ncbi:MAG: hypothetical protein M1498_00910 [Candidatus Thermoplasmatota archaeon]|nr:hypothetical protein [Candidatus Thermoplasmatota archaeon]
MIPLTDRIIEDIGSDVRGNAREWMLEKGTVWPIRLATDPIVLSDKYDTVKIAYIFCIMDRDGKIAEEISKKLKAILKSMLALIKRLKQGTGPW